MSLNLAVLQRLDAKINQIIATAGHVALYKFLPATQAWERKEVEGSLFVVERTEEPLHTIVVLNRISIENFCEPITPGLQMRVSEPYLLLRNYKNETTGVWFYSKEEQHKISQAVRALLDAKAAGTTAGPGTAGAAGTKKSKAVPPAAADKERTATTKTTTPLSADKEKASSPVQGGAGGGPPGLSAPSASVAAAPPAAVKPSAPSSNGYAPLGMQTNVASLLSAVLSGSGGSGGGPSYAQAVARDSVGSPATPAVATPAPAPAPVKPEQESQRDPHGSNAAGAALLNLLQPSADSRERDAAGQHQLPPPHQQQQQQNGPLVHPHPHQLHPHPQPLFPPHLLHPQQLKQQQQQPQQPPPHFLHPAGGPGQPHMVPPGMHPGQHPHPHQPLLPHHPIMRQPMQPGMHPGQPPLMPQPAQMMHHPQQQSARSLASKQHLRSVLLSLANDDSFIDMVYESYMTQLAHGASQKSATS